MCSRNAKNTGYRDLTKCH